MALAGQPPQTTQVYSAQIVTSDPTTSTITALLPGSLRPVVVQGTPVAFRWPVAGEVWRIVAINGSFYLDSPLPIQENSSTAAMSATNPDMTTINSIEPGDAVLNSPTGKIWVLGSQDGSTDFSFDADSFDGGGGGGGGGGTDAITNTVVRAHNSTAWNLSTSNSKVLIDTIDIDPGGCFVPADNEYVCPVAGLYRVQGTYSTSGPNGVCALFTFKNDTATNTEVVSQPATGTLTCQIEDVIRCAAGDTISLVAIANVGGAFSITPGYATMDVALIGSLTNAPISPSTGSRAYLGSSQTIGAGWTKVTLNTIQSGDDPGSHWDTTNYNYKVSVSGLYLITAGVSYYPGTTGVLEAYIAKNTTPGATGGDGFYLSVVEGATPGIQYSVSGGGLIRCVAGDTLALWGATAGGNGIAQGGASYQTTMSVVLVDQPVQNGGENTGWFTPTLINGWTNGYNAPQYMKDASGFVHIRGSADAVGVSTNSDMFTLPAGYRPGISDYYSVLGTDAYAGNYVYIDTAGNVQGVTGSSSNQIMFGGSVNFLAEN